MIPYIIELSRHIDSRGVLTICEGEKDVYFPICRALWVTNAPRDSVRGGRAYHTTHQLIVSLNGSVDVECSENTHHLDRPFVALHIPPENKFTLRNFSTNSVVLVLCSKPYDKSDYMKEQQFPIICYQKNSIKPRFWFDLHSYYKSVCLG
jgi:hypothetical protein